MWIQDNLNFLMQFLQVACKLVAVLVHYFSLASFTWIFLEAAMLYLKTNFSVSGRVCENEKFPVVWMGYVYFINL